MERPAAHCRAAARVRHALRPAHAPPAGVAMVAPGTPAAWPACLPTQAESQQPFFLGRLVRSSVEVSLRGEALAACTWSTCSCCRRCITSCAMVLNTWRGSRGG